MSDPQNYPPNYPPPPGGQPTHGQPYGAPPPGQPYAGQPPYGAPPGYPPRPRGNKGLWLALGSLGVVAVATVATLELTDVIDLFPNGTTTTTTQTPVGIGGGGAAPVATGSTLSVAYLTAHPWCDNLQGRVVFASGGQVSVYAGQQLIGSGTYSVAGNSFTLTLNGRPTTATPTIVDANTMQVTDAQGRPEYLRAC